MFIYHENHIIMSLSWSADYSLKLQYHREIIDAIIKKELAENLMAKEEREMTEERDKILCPSCKSEVAEPDNKCPKCGVAFIGEELKDTKPVNTVAKKRNIGILLVSLVLIGIVAYNVEKPKYDAYVREQQVEQQYQAGINDIKQQNWSAAYDIFGNMSPQYKDTDTLCWYAEAKKEYGTDDMSKWNAYSSMEQVSNDYKGAFSSDVLKFKKQLENDPSNQKTEADIAPYQPGGSEYGQNAPSTPTDPQIGMTKDQVLNSLWGQPQDINKTTTAYGTSEQWVYGDGRYVYFDNGIVTTIQQ